VVLLTDINQWWDALSSAHQVFWFIAIIFSVLFMIQFILLLIGVEASGGDLDHPGDIGTFEHEFSALSVRSIIAFFTFFGWTGVLALNNHLHVWLAVIFASIAGLAAMFIVAYMVFKLSQLEQSGTLNLFNALDKQGEVYLPIPAHGKGVGKIHLNVDGRIRELDAMTEGDALKTGTPVRVTEIMKGNILMVEYTPLSIEKKIL
jgi:membrane protein implicated in regulation of membrane protease activity